jgi:hypothetical protein
MEVEDHALVLAPGRRGGGDALADLQGELAQPIVKGADVAEADQHTARFAERHRTAV